MLQINSGKLYQHGVGRKNHLRGVLYSNLTIAGLDDKPIVTEAGTLLAAEPMGTPTSLVYELIEQIEDGRNASGVLVSHTVWPYLHDFSAVVSFALNVTCAPDYDLCTRLLSGKRSLTVAAAPSKLVNRVFDRQVWCQPADGDFLIAFVKDLIALRRKSFLAAMAAIRTYVTGMHRVSEDLELTYTLIVAAIESLVRGFDGHGGTWSDIETRKRERVDEAIKDADAGTAERVRRALIESEELALSRRFRKFAMDHIASAYYRETGHAGVAGRLDMRDALREAYQLRSRYIHNLGKLPDLLSADRGYSEIVHANHATYLTLQGLARVARHIIREFVSRQPKVETEKYDYSLERHGVVRAELAPQYWIGNAQGLQPTLGRKWLESFLQQYSAHLRSKTAITELGAVLVRIEEMLPLLNKRQRVPFSVLYFLYNRIVGAEHRAANVENVIQRYKDDIVAPSPETLVLYVLEFIAGWPLDQHRTQHDHYFEQRNHPRGFRAPGLFEAGFTLSIGERYRTEGRGDDAKALLTFAAENHPTMLALQALERDFDPTKSIDWWEILLPGRSEKR
jgi:hypothetical protein